LYTKVVSETNIYIIYIFYHPAFAELQTVKRWRDENGSK